MVLAPSCANDVAPAKRIPNSWRTQVVADGAYYSAANLVSLSMGLGLCGDMNIPEPAATAEGESSSIGGATGKGMLKEEISGALSDIRLTMAHLDATYPEWSDALWCAGADEASPQDLEALVASAPHPLLAVMAYTMLSIRRLTVHAPV